MINSIKEKLSVLTEFIEYLIDTKKYVLIPIVIILVIFGLLMVLTQGTALSPFIYVLF